MPGDAGTTIEGPNAWKSKAIGSNGRRGIVLSVLCIRPTIERVGSVPVFPCGHPRDTRVTIWTKSGSFAFLTRDLEQGPILAPEYGFFVRDSGPTGASAAASDVLPLPKGQGTEVLECLKRNAQTAHIPVITLTGITGPGVKRRLMCLGAVGYFHKPVPFDELLEEVSHYLTVPARRWTADARPSRRPLVTLQIRHNPCVRQALPTVDCGFGHASRPALN